MIYDCFPFNFDMDILEIRLEELSPYVDKFILVEAGVNFDNTQKQMWYAMFKDTRFKRFSDRIIHGCYSTLPGNTNLERGLYQVEGMATILQSIAKDGDWIIISDDDEIPRGSKLGELISTGFGDYPFRTFQQHMFMYYVNDLWTTKWPASTIMPMWYFRKEIKTAREARLRRREGIRIGEGGWHFSRTGGADNVSRRMRSSYHTDWLDPKAWNVEALEKKIEEGRGASAKEALRMSTTIPIESEGYFPKYLVDNRERFSGIIRRR